MEPMEPGMRDCSILLVHHQPRIVSVQFFPLKRLNSVPLWQNPNTKLEGPPWKDACESLRLDWKPPSHGLQTCHSVRNPAFLLYILCLLAPAHLALVLSAWAAPSWPCQGLIMKCSPKHLPGTVGKQVRSWNHWHRPFLGKLMESWGAVRGLGMSKCYSNRGLTSWIWSGEDYSDDGVCAFKSDGSPDTSMMSLKHGLY